MSTERSYKEIFADLGDWMPEIIHSIKKDCRNEHLKGDRAFCRQYLPAKVLHKVGAKDLATAYQQAIADGKEDVGEFIASRWVLRNAEAYQLFEVELQKINPQFDQIEQLDPSQAAPLMEKACQELGASNTYIFSILNAVAFSDEDMKKLREAAIAEKSAAPTETAEVTQSAEELQQKFERELQRSSERYEKRLDGLQRKHLAEVAALKKQIANLQKRLDGAQG